MHAIYECKINHKNVKRMVLNFMRMLVVADMYDIALDQLQSLDVGKFDIAVSLGNVELMHLKWLAEAFAGRVYGLLGNHDCKWYLQEAGIQDLHCQPVVVNGIKMIGMGGAWRYKDADAPLLTDEESVAIAEHILGADILLSHDAAKGLYSGSWCHPGLAGINRYVEIWNPVANLHGHHHINDMNMLGNTCMIGVFGAVSVEISKVNGKCKIGKIDVLE
jgi:Icc-related predicted phosphoesterase